MPKTWKEKFNNGKIPEVKLLQKDFAGLKANTTMLISTPKEIAEYMDKIPSGQIISFVQMREDLAKKHQAEGTCPVTTGIFSRIVAELALEEINQGKKPSEVTPFWRVVDPESKLAQKLPPLVKEFIARMRENEAYG